ncbi:MAG TPA: hypothetical protein VGP48_02895 [Stellaceae bacterium]|jgi:hypothetical protein|nr:hypothetical protein [Stellaceae bacterium]
MRIGVDFDNTLIDYDRVFLAAAKRHGLIEPSFAGTKRAIRDRIRLLPDGELRWQELQGYVYGAGIGDAVMCVGADEFLRECRRRGAEIFVVSHKTQFGHFDPQRVDLRVAALDWMTRQGFFRADSYGIARENVFFESSRADKLRRIRALGCAFFIDDLEEVFADPDFPDGVTPVLFAASGGPGLAVCPDWARIRETVLGGLG